MESQVGESVSGESGVSLDWIDTRVESGWRVRGESMGGHGGKSEMSLDVK